MMILRLFLKTRRITGILLIAAGIAAGVFLCKKPELRIDVIQELQKLPDYDYIAEARRLAAQKKYEEAIVICEDVISCGLPGKRQAVILKDICESKARSVSNRILRIAWAFASGNSSGKLEESAAAVLSDMMMYGDIRDLTIQGYLAVTGGRSDPMIAALAGAGLLTEFADAVDWAPALLKVLRRTSALSDNLCRDLLKIIRRYGVKAPETRRVCYEIADLYRRGGSLRTGVLMRNLDSVKDIHNISKLSADSLPAACLFARSAGKRTASAAEKLLKRRDHAVFLRRLILKGPNGITLFLRGAKSIRKGNAGNLLTASLRRFKEKAGYWSLMLPGVLIFTGSLLMYRRKKH